MTGKIALVTTGGTIASRQVGDSVISVDAPETLLRAAGIGTGAVEVIAFSNLGSNLIGLQMALDLAQRIEALLARADIDGCVVTHGTDTLEESLFLASLVVASPKPVVFTGAQLSADRADADGPGNLVAALRFAGSPQARGIGPVLVFAGDILDAVQATKIDALAPAAYAAPHDGPIGSIRGDTITLFRRAERRIVASSSGLPTGAISPDVFLLPAVMGMDGRLIDAAVHAGARGIVLEGFGCGNATPAIVAALVRAHARGVVSVVTSCCLRGDAVPLYGDGGGYHLAQAGAIFAGRLQGKKARILLALTLGLRDRSDRPIRAEDFLGF